MFGLCEAKAVISVKSNAFYITIQQEVILFTFVYLVAERKPMFFENLTTSRRIKNRF